jgi:hypothetical protein
VLTISIIGQGTICFAHGVGEFMHRGHESVQAGAQGGKMFLLETTAPIVAPIFFDTGPKTGKVQEITPKSVFGIRQWAKIKRHETARAVLPSKVTG